MNDEPNTYDEVPYASRPFPQTHVNRLATVATLFGMQPQPIDDCRVLELGCGAGGNLIPMAAALPGSRFVGVDLALSQIEQARATVEQLGLKNVELHGRSILEIDAEFGSFDYIICHGVWSWVPAEVREKILAICQQQLAPAGVAYVSYNALPGWHMRAIVREMMVYHTRKLTAPQSRAGHARALIDFLIRSVPAEANAYSLLLKDEMELLRKLDDSYLLHEHLERVNEPMYFHEFEAQAAARGLRYLGEADVGTMLSAGFGAEVEAILQYLATSLEEREQYLDFLKNRMFRQTLLCRREVALNWQPDYERMRRLCVASPLVQSAADQSGAPDSEVVFEGQFGVLKTADPVLKSALRALAKKWPEAVRLEDLFESTQSLIHPAAPADAPTRAREAALLAKGLLNCFAKRFFDLYALPPACKALPGVRPAASPVVRLQAARGTVVTNLHHRTTQLDAIGRQLVLLCDGTRDLGQILDGLMELSRQGVLVLRDSAGAFPDAAQTRTILGQTLGLSLARLARLAVLVG